MRKTKRLKDFSLSYYGKTDDVWTDIFTIKENKYTTQIHIPKRQFLSLLKFGLENMKLSFKQRKELEAILEKRNIEYIRDKVAKVKTKKRSNQ